MRKDGKELLLVMFIAIMGGLTAILVILTPSIITYVQFSNIQQDYAATDALVLLVEDALSDPKIHEEIYRYSCANNYLTYSDSSGYYGQKSNGKEYWAPDGSGKATTITFNPKRSLFSATSYQLDEAIVNDMTYGNGSRGESRIIEVMQLGHDSFRA